MPCSGGTEGTAPDVGMIGQKISHYTIVDELGSGGMGVVYRAMDRRLDRSVALKFLSEELSRDAQAVERFHREARAASALNHPHICSVYDVGEHGGRHFIVMELLDGASLSTHIARGPLPVANVLAVGAQIAEALEIAHARGIVHRDIKPANIFVTRQGAAKLLDFGVAALVAPSSRTQATTMAQVTQAGEVVGTLAYMSPEQVRGEALDVTSDLFSFGVVLYEMATGRQPFQGATSGVILEAILNRVAPAPVSLNRHVPAGLEAIIEKALEKERGLRYQSAREMRADLQRLQRDLEGARRRVASVPAPAATPSRPRRRALFAALAAAGLSVLAAGGWFAWRTASADSIDSLAVLPFVNGSGDPDREYLTDGLTESLINNLSQIHTLRVSARSSVFRYKGKEVDPQQVGRDLRVRAVLSGRLLQRHDRVVIRAELVDVANGAQLWGQEYSRSAADVFTLQENLSAEISEKLRLRLSAEEERQLGKRHTDDPVAYELYLRGRLHWNKRNIPDIRKAIEYFNRAVAEDPRYALAYAGLADAYNLASFFNYSPPHDVMPRARAAAAKALEIDERLAEAHISLAYVNFTYDWDYPAATRHFERARALNPAVVANHVYYPFYLTIGGRHEEAIRTADQAIELDPLSAALSHNRAVQLALARRYPAAVEECRRTIELDPGMAVAYEVMGAAYAAQGEYSQARPLMERAVKLNPANTVSVALLGYVDGRLGERKRALQVLRELEERARERYVPAFSFAVLQVGLGDIDRAFEWLDKAYAERYNRLAYLRVEPTWDPVRADPRFDALQRRIGLPRLAGSQE